MRLFFWGEMGQSERKLSLFKNFILNILFSWGIFFLLTSQAQAATYLRGAITADGEGFAGNSYVYLTCQKSSNSYYYNYLSDYATVDSNGQYNLSGGNSYNPCYSGNTDLSSYSCEVYAYQWGDDTITNNSQYYSVALDCDSTLIQDIDFQTKDKTISMTLNEGAITDGMTVYCSQNAKPYTYSYESTATDSRYDLLVIPGTYNCGAYCTWDYWYNLGQTCPYSGYPQKTITVAEDDTTVSDNLNFTTKDKTISVAVYVGNDLLTEDITVYCNQQESPWTYANVSTPSDEGTYDCLVTSGYYYVSAYCQNWPCDFTGSPSTYVTVGDSDSSVDATLTYEIKDKLIRTKVMAGDSQIKSGVTTYCYKQGGDWSSSYAYSANSDGLYEQYVGTGTQQCSAYCNDWRSCDIAGYPTAKVVVEEADETIDITLTFLQNDTTLSGVVTNGSSGVADAWISIQSDQTSTEEAVSSSFSAATRFATVTGGSAQLSQIYASAQTDSNGAFVVMVPKGSYKITASPPWNLKNYAQASTSVTTNTSGTTTVTLALREKTASINGRITDSNGNPVKASISGWTSSGSAVTSDWSWAESDSDGYYTIYAVENVTYNLSAYAYTWGNDVTANTCPQSNEGMQTVTATSTEQTVNFTFPICDCKMTVNAVDGSGNILSQMNASVDAKPSAFASDEHYYGIWGWLQSGTGTVNVEEGREYSYRVWSWDNDYDFDEEVLATCSDGAGSVDVAFVEVIDDAISGKFVANDEEVTITNSYISVYATRGNIYRHCDTTSSGYSCNLSEGSDWSLGYWIDPNSGYASATAGTTSKNITITSAQQTYNLTLLKVGYVAVTVFDHDQQTPRANVWVEATPYSVGQEGANDYQHAYGSSGCQTNDEGQCTISAGATEGNGITYYINTFIPYDMKNDETISNPPEQEVAVITGQTAEVTLNYQKPDHIAKITALEGDISTASTSAISLATALIPEGQPRLAKSVLNAQETAAASPVANATVDCFSNNGGSFEVQTDVNGLAECPCTSSDVWYGVVHNKVSNAIYLSDVTEVTCDSETENTLSVDFVTVAPEGVSITLTEPSTQAGTVELSDKFSVTFPAGAFGDATQVTINADTVITPFTANKIPASFYAYRVTAFDENGAAINQLSTDATFKVPVNVTQVDNLGLTLKDISSNYFSDSIGAYIEIKNSVVHEADNNDSDNFITFTQNHLTDFAVVGNGYLGGIKGEDDGPIGIGDAEGSGGCGCLLNAHARWQTQITPYVLFFISAFVVLWKRHHSKKFISKK